jgi:hypothetical protein
MALAMTPRRSSLAAVASAVAAMALAAAVAGRSCRVSQPGPVAAVRDLIQAAKTGDRDTVFELLAPATRAQLEVEAKNATALVGAAVRYTAKDLISIGSSEGVAVATDITVVAESGEHATVEIVSGASRERLELVKVDGRWKITLAAFAGPE